MTSARAFNVGFISIIGKPGKIKQKTSEWTGLYFTLRGAQCRTGKRYPESTRTGPGRGLPRPVRQQGSCSKSPCPAWLGWLISAIYLPSVSRGKPVDDHDKGPVAVVLIGGDLIIDPDPHALEPNMQDIVRRAEVNGAVIASFVGAEEELDI